MVYISEMFGPTIQGEGRKRGNVSSFLRVAGCNMQCKGFGIEYEINGEVKKGCDTWYAVDKNLKSEWKLYDDHKVLINDFKKFIGKNKEIVITGGEPLIYWNKSLFQEFIKYFIRKSFKITIETNGSIEIDFFSDYHKEIMFSISPKLSFSKESFQKRINIKALRKLLEKGNDSYLKFVVSKDTIEQDKNEIKDILKSIDLNCDVFIMPLTVNDKKKYHDNILAAVNLCIEDDYIFSNRDHVTIWGDKRGV